MTEFRIDTSEQGPCAVVAVVGELDVYTAPAFRAELMGMINAGKKPIVVNLLGTEFIDSTALGVMAEASKRARARNSDLRITCTRAHVLKVLEITSMDRVVRVFPTVEDACAAEVATAPPA